MRRAAPLRADLDDAVMLPRGGKHRLAFNNIDADWFLAVNVRARFEGSDHRERMPMIRRSDEHDVEVLFLEHLAIITVGARFLFRFLPVAYHLGGVREHVLVHVTQRNHFHRRNLNQAKQIGLAVPT